MPARFLHTADWQLGRSFARVEDPAKRVRLQQERFDVLARIGAAAKENGAEFILVAGDAFDSPHASKTIVAAACSAIGSLGLPVYLIPGNHDHGGPDSLWEQPFFRREAAKLSPNLHVLLKAEPVELDNAIILPCPLLRRHDATDTTQWLRSPELIAALPHKARIVLAHGSTQRFGSFNADDEGDDHAANLLDLSRLPANTYDYIALGDWHGAKEIAPNAWYAGTPELDRFPRGEDYAGGNALLVEATRGSLPSVRKIATARLGWHQTEFTLPDDASVERLATHLDRLIETRAGSDLLELDLSGTLSLEATARLQTLLESYQARLLRFKLRDRTVTAPSEAEINALTQRASDPLLSRVAAKLLARTTGSNPDEAAVARLALRELHAQLSRIR
jgi:DNA repair exonuclease SbcCD nuclease subunit